MRIIKIINVNSYIQFSEEQAEVWMFTKEYKPQ